MASPERSGMICYQNNCSFTLLTRGVTFAATWHSGQLGRRAGNLEFHRICLVSTHRQPLGPERMQRFSHSVPLQFRVQGKVLHGFCCSTPSSARQLHLVLEEADFERFWMLSRIASVLSVAFSFPEGHNIRVDIL